VHAINGLEMRIFSIGVSIHHDAIFGGSGSEACCVPDCEEEYGEHEWSNKHEWADKIERA